jgi:chromosome segregation ATPase
MNKEQQLQQELDAANKVISALANLATRIINEKINRLKEENESLRQADERSKATAEWVKDRLHRARLKHDAAKQQHEAKVSEFRQTIDLIYKNHHAKMDELQAELDAARKIINAMDDNDMVELKLESALRSEIDRLKTELCVANSRLEASREEGEERRVEVAELKCVLAATRKVVNELREEVARLQDCYDMQSKELLRVLQDKNESAGRYYTEIVRVCEELNVATRRVQELELANTGLKKALSKEVENRDATIEALREDLRAYNTPCTATPFDETLVVKELREEVKRLRNTMASITCKIATLRTELIEMCNHSVMTSDANSVIQWIINDLRGL